MPNYKGGMCQVCGLELATKRNFFCDDHKIPLDRPEDRSTWHRPPEPIIQLRPEETGDDENEPARAVPTPPQPETLRQGFLGLLRKNKKPRTTTAKKRSSSVFVQKGPRRSGVLKLGEFWVSGGEFLMASPWPMAGRVMTFQGESAGTILDDAIKGTFIDKTMVQPALAFEETWGAVLRLLTLPVQMEMVWAKIQRIQQLQAEGADQTALLAQQGQLNWAVKSAHKSIRRALPELARAAKRQKEEREAAQEAFTEAYPELVGTKDETGRTLEPEEVLFREIMGPFIASMEAQEGMAGNGKQQSWAGAREGGGEDSMAS